MPGHRVEFGERFCENDSVGMSEVLCCLLILEGVYVDMDADPPAMCWQVRGKWSEVIRAINNTAGDVFYPAVTMCNNGEKLELKYPVPIPQGVPNYCLTDAGYGF